MTDDASAILQAVSANSDSANWCWHEQEKAHWGQAPLVWQKFADRWRNVTEEDLHPETDILDLGPRDVTPGSLEINQLFVRKCYLDAETFIWNEATRARGAGVIFTGQPGTGKTIFIWYFLICLLQKKQVVLFHVRGSDSLLFHLDGVYAAPRTVNVDCLPRAVTTKAAGPAAFIWSLFDIAEQDSIPLIATYPRYERFPIQTTSPDQNLYGGKRWQKERVFVTVTGFPMWTHEELLRCASLQLGFSDFKESLNRTVNNWGTVSKHGMPHYPGVFEFLKKIYEKDQPKSSDDALDTILDALVKGFGPFPQNVFAAMYDLNMAIKNHEVSLFFDLDRLKEIVRHTLELYPATPGFHHFSISLIDDLVGAMDWQINFKSKYIGKQITDRLDKQEDENELREFVKSLASVPERITLAGVLSEPFVRRDIQKATGKWSFKKMDIQRPPGSKAPTFVLEDPAEETTGFQNIKRTPVYFNMAEIPEKLTNKKHYIPRNSSLSLFDSFVVDSDGRTAHLWFLQTTISDTHGGSARGYLEIRRIIQRVREQLHDLRPGPSPSKKQKQKQSEEQDVRIHVHYVLVRPAVNVGPRPKWVLPKGWDDDATQDDHRGDGYLMEFLL